MQWIESIAKAAQDAATSRHEPPEAAQTELCLSVVPETRITPQAEESRLNAADRVALMDAIEKGRTAQALNLALRVIADLTGDRALIDANAQSRAAMGEEWRRAYKVWATYAPRIRAAQTEAEALSAYDAAIDACAQITDGTGKDGVLLGVAVLDMLEQVRKDRA